MPDSAYSEMALEQGLVACLESSSHRFVMAIGQPIFSQIAGFHMGGIDG